MQRGQGVREGEQENGIFPSSHNRAAKELDPLHERGGVEGEGYEGRRGSERGRDSEGEGEEGEEAKWKGRGGVPHPGTGGGGTERKGRDDGEEGAGGGRTI